MNKKLKIRLLAGLLLCTWLAACGAELDTPTIAPATTTATAIPASKTTTAQTSGPISTTPAPTITATSTSTVAVSLPTITASPPAVTVNSTVSQPATTTTSTAASSPVISAGPAATAGSGPAAFSADLAFKHVQKLAGEIGIRAAGTEGERQAGDYIEKNFQQAGLKTERPEFDYTSIRDQGSVVTFQEKEVQNTVIKGNAVNLSGSARVNGPMSYAGMGMDGQIPRDSLRGKIALIQRGQLRFSEKVENAAAAGASGVIIYNNIEGSLDSATLDKATALPVLGISLADGERLREELRVNKNLTVDLKVDIARTPIKSSNVVGIRASKEPEAKILIIGGHYDSVPAGPGANDNASGTAVVMELARVLQGQFPQFELRFVAFGAEEIGLVGSTSYADKLSEAERLRVKAMINIDMVSVGQQWLVGGTPDLTRLALAASTAAGAGNTRVLPEDSQGSSDHYPFQLAGLPVLFLNRESDPNYHKPGDTPEKVKPASLEQVGNITLQVVTALAKS